MRAAFLKRNFFLIILVAVAVVSSVLAFAIVQVKNNAMQTSLRSENVGVVQSYVPNSVVNKILAVSQQHPEDVGLTETAALQRYLNSGLNNSSSIHLVDDLVGSAVLKGETVWNGLSVSQQKSLDAQKLNGVVKVLSTNTDVYQVPHLLQDYENAMSAVKS